MGVLEIVLLAAGGIIFILSFLIPARGGERQETAAPVAREEIRSMIDRELDAVKGHVDDVVEEAVTYAMEKTERSLERLSNEKIMAINEYSDTVLAEIHKNHEEAVFLYDMLNSKHTNLKDTVSQVTRTVKEAEETVNSFQRLAPETIPAAAAAPQQAPRTAEDTREQSLSQPRTPKAAFVRAAVEEMTREGRGSGPEEAFYDGEREEADASGNSNERILKLYSQGMDKVAIARELGLGVGEVKLVIDLFEGNG